jgi:dTDP-4-amino-4,6-dideoxygalactose transaminase
MQVPFMDLKRQYDMIKDEIDQALSSTIETTAFVAGSKVKEFEDNFARYCGVEHAIGVSNGTGALYAALKAHDIGKHDIVVTSPMTFIATAEAISMTNAEPVFVDIDENSFDLSPARLREYIKKNCEWSEKKKALIDNERKARVRAVIPVHLYGQVGEMDEIKKIAKENNLLVLEDACQAHGAEYKGKKAGALGDIAAFSFYPSKNLGAYGQGGMILTGKPEIAEKIRILIDHGQKERNHHVVEGWNFKMDGFQAAILNVKLGYLDDWNEDRRQNVKYYTELLSGVDKIVLPKELPDRKHIYHVFAARVKDRPGFMEFMKKEGVGTSIHYPLPLHLQPAYQHLGFEAGIFPVAEQAANEVVSLPMFPELTKQEIEYTCNKIREWANLSS